jgi:hypothetical protein
MSALMVKKLELIEQFWDLSLVSELTPSGVKLGMLKLTSNILEEIKEGQKEDSELVNHVVLVYQGKGVDFRLDVKGVLMLCDWICVPDIHELKKRILEECHRSSLSIHPGVTKMYQDLKKLFWWPGMKKDIAEFVYACNLICHKSKIEHQKPLGLMQPLFVLEWKWDSIIMDFVGALPKTVKGSDSIWVIADQLAKSTHFIPIKTGMFVARLVEIYFKKVAKLHDIPSNIVSYRDLRFTSKFWESLQAALGTKLTLSSAYHHQTDGQTEMTIQYLEDLLRVCVLEQDVSWDVMSHR